MLPLTEVVDKTMQRLAEHEAPTHLTCVALHEAEKDKKPILLDHALTLSAEPEGGGPVLRWRDRDKQQPCLSCPCLACEAFE